MASKCPCHPKSKANHNGFCPTFSHTCAFQYYGKRRNHLVSDIKYPQTQASFHKMSASQRALGPPNRQQTRPLALFSAAKMLLVAIAQLPLLHAAPLGYSILGLRAQQEPSMSANKPTLWIYLSVAIGLVLLGGAFAGLTIALMGQVRAINPNFTAAC